MSNPFFSVVIPAYNREDFICQTIDSVLNQNFKDFEIIVVDDGSTDQTKAVFDENYGENSQVRYIYTVNKERGHARNLGFKNAVGEFVFFIDSDDYMLPNHLQTLHEEIAKHPQYNLYATKLSLKRGERTIELGISGMPEGPYHGDAMILGNPFGTLFCVRRSYHNLILFDEDRGLACMEDWIFILRNTLRTPIYLVDKTTIQMVDHDGRSMANNALVIERRIKAMNYILEREKLNDHQKKQLRKHSYIFCCNHSILDKKYSDAYRYAWNAIRINPWAIKSLLLLPKIAYRKFIKPVSLPSTELANA